MSEPEVTGAPKAGAGRFAHRAKVAEAAVALGAARLLIAAAPWRLWRWTLGAPVAPGGSGARRPDAGQWDLTPEVRQVRRAVDAACRRLPVELVCLPRAMAMHWMLRRRGIRSTLLIGVAPGESPSARPFEMHAWIETDGRVGIGEDPSRTYRPCAVFAGGPERAS